MYKVFLKAFFKKTSVWSLNRSSGYSRPFLFIFQTLPRYYAALFYGIMGSLQAIITLSSVVAELIDGLYVTKPTDSILAILTPSFHHILPAD